MKKHAVLICLMLFPLLGGCWDSKELQTMAYGTALGFDYAEGQYTVYAQIQNFTNIAKTENASPGKNIPAWIGLGRGSSVLEAVADLSATSQLRMFWGHLNAIVVSESIITEHKLPEVTDVLNRFREIRYNIQMFGTREPLGQIFAVKSLLNFSPLESLLSRPTKYYEQRPYVSPIRGLKFIADMNEPGYSAYLPSLAIDKRSWREDKQSKPMFRISGAYFFNAREYAGWMSEQSLIGVRWINKRIRMDIINIPDDTNPKANLNLFGHRFNIQPIIREEDVAFSLSIDMKGSVSGLWSDIGQDELERMAEAYIAQEMRATYERGISKKIDVYRLSQTLYRRNPAAFHRLMANRPFPLTKESLASVKVNVHIIHSGKYKGEK